jgi:MFS family permease
MTARILQGAGFGVTSTLVLSMAATIIPSRRMAEGLGYIGLGTTVAMAAGPLLGLFLANRFGYEVMFVAMSSFVMLAAVVTLAIPNIELFEHHKVEKPSGFHGIHLDKRPLPAAALAIFYGVAISSVTSYMAIYASQKHLPSAAMFFVTSTIGTLISRVFAGKLYDRHGHMAVIPLAAVILCSSFLLIVKSSGAGVSHAVFFISSILYGLGVGSVFPSIQTLTLSSTPPAKRTSSSVTFYVCFDLGSGVGSFMLGFVAEGYRDYKYVYLAAALSMVVFFLCYAFFFIWPKRRRAIEEAARRP